MTKINIIKSVCRNLATSEVQYLNNINIKKEFKVGYEIEQILTYPPDLIFIYKTIYKHFTYCDENSVQYFVYDCEKQTVAAHLTDKFKQIFTKNILKMLGEDENINDIL